MEQTKTMTSFKRILWAFLIFSLRAVAQKTANDTIPDFPSAFSYGVSSSYYEGFNGGNATVRNIADLAKNAKVRGFRQIVLDQFMDTYTPDYELNNFKYLATTDSISTISLYLSTPSLQHRAKDSITCSLNGAPVKYRSEVFANLHTPIWDDSVNAKTPINDNNYYARYVYNLVKSYNKYVKVYEVWNAPDFSNSLNADRLKGDPGNWWDSNPSPCDLVSLHASFTDYVRMLRITYEVVKSVDPTAIVALGGISRENFLDAVLRNTDNPDAGKVTAAYPRKGGAYFDAVAYQSLPQYTLKEWDDNLKVFKYFRHSDAAAQKVKDTKSKFNNLLHKYGYNDTLYPNKYFVISKVNIPRKQYFDRDFIGSVEAQRNFLAKLYIVGQKSGLKYINLCTVGDTRTEAQSASDLEGNDLMGLYYNLNQATVATAALNKSGEAIKSVITLLEGYAYDSALTRSLNLNSTVDGAVFVKQADTLISLWAKTKTDLSEEATADYVLPAAFAGQNSLMEIHRLDYATTRTPDYYVGNRLPLTASPVFVRLKVYTGLDDDKVSLSYQVFPNPTKGVCTVQCLRNTSGDKTVTLLDVMGKPVYTTTFQEPSARLDLPALSSGIYQLILKDQLYTSVLQLVVE